MFGDKWHQLFLFEGHHRKQLFILIVVIVPLISILFGEVVYMHFYKQGYFFQAKPD